MAAAARSLIPPAQARRTFRYKFHGENAPALPVARKGQSGRLLRRPQRAYPAATVVDFCTAVSTREKGSIVAIASTAARTPRIAQGAYCGSKAAVAQLMCVAGLELAPKNIRVNYVFPGVTETGMFRRLMATLETPEVVVGGNLAAFRLPVPLGRLARSEEIADVVAFLLSDRSTYLTMQDIVVDGGGAIGASRGQQGRFRGADLVEGCVAAVATQIVVFPVFGLAGQVA